MLKAPRRCQVPRCCAVCTPPVILILTIIHEYTLHASTRSRFPMLRLFTPASGSVPKTTTSRKSSEFFDQPADEDGVLLSQGSGGWVSYDNIKCPSSVFYGVIETLRFDPEAVLESCSTLQPGRRSRSRIRVIRHVATGV